MIPKATEPMRGIPVARVMRKRVMGDPILPENLAGRVMELSGNTGEIHTRGDHSAV
jgi:hypothetical protein